MARNNWSLNAFRSINWDVPERALDTLENSAQVFITKFVHDQPSAHSMTHAWDQMGQNRQMPRMPAHCL
jgi:hypothetical protein